MTNAPVPEVMPKAVTLGDDPKTQYTLLELNFSNNAGLRIDEPVLTGVQPVENVNHLVQRYVRALLNISDEEPFDFDKSVEKINKDLSPRAKALGQLGVIYRVLSPQNIILYQIQVVVLPTPEPERVEVKVPVEVPVEVKVPVANLEDKKSEPKVEHGKITTAQRKGMTSKTIPPIFKTTDLTKALAYHMAFEAPVSAVNLKVKVASAEVAVHSNEFKELSVTDGAKMLDQLTEKLLALYKELHNVFKVRDYTNYTFETTYNDDVATVTMFEQAPVVEEPTTDETPNTETAEDENEE